MAAPAGDRASRALGGLAFAAGIAVIAMVLSLAFRLFNDKTAGIPEAAGPASSAAAMAMGTSFLRLLVRLAVLFLACLCGSMIAGKGVQLLIGGRRQTKPED